MKRTPLRRKTPLRSRGAVSKRQQDDLDAFRLALHVRSGGFCEAHTPACPPGRHEGVHCHHIAPSDRRRGVHDPERGLFCCLKAHHHIHANPAESYENGWLLRSAA
jgi:hypothetical protein